MTRGRSRDQWVFSIRASDVKRQASARFSSSPGRAHQSAYSPPLAKDQRAHPSKFEQRGKARFHQRANAAEQAICRRWLAAEILTIDPLIVVALGTMAARTLFGVDFRISKSRGSWVRNHRGVALATWHPTAVWRAPDRDRRHEMEQPLTMDLAKVQRCLARVAQRAR